ncbi:MAG: ribonuclease PH [Candidatus Babeliales bacterium]
MQPKNKLRHDGRLNNQLRPISFVYNIFEYRAGSVFFELGKNKILCSITLQNNVPIFLRGKNTGWLTAEYAMLPASTMVRTQRESQVRKNGRSIEISRFIGRSLRSVVDVSVLGERTVIVDCDIIQADGGTRTACVTAAYLALQYAQEKWLQSKKIEKPFLRDGIVGVSVGILNDEPMLDLDYAEDSNIDADFNFVITQSGMVVEIQGNAEKKPISWSLFENMRLLAIEGAKQLFEQCKQNANNIIIFKKRQANKVTEINKKLPLFSLRKRQLNL